jgi:hypothetical protein
MIAAFLRTLGPAGYLLILSVVVIGLLIIQTVRLSHAHEAKLKAEAALIDPVSKQTWARQAHDLRIAVDAQNRAVEAIAANADAKIAQSQAAASRAISQAKDAQAVAASLLRRKPAGNTTCERAEDQQRAFLEAVR